MTLLRRRRKVTAPAPFHERFPDLIHRCPTCHERRLDMSMPCDHCGEVE